MRIWILLLLGVLSAQGKEDCHFSGIEEFKRQLLLGSPIEEEISAQYESASSFVEKAKQRPNPNAEFEYQRGDQFGLEVNTYNLKLLHTLELGSKREKRIRESMAKEELTKSKLSLSQAEFYLSALIDYRRAQQLELQIKAIKEASATYENIINKLSKRKRLTPEERVSLSTLKLAQGDYEGRLHELVHEKETLIVKVSFWARCQDPKFQYSVVSYPKLPHFELDAAKGLAKIEKGRVEMARASLDVQKSLGYSDLKVGPLLNYQQQGQDEFLSAGIGITFNAPVFHTNQGGKALAAKKLMQEKVSAKNNLELMRLKLKKELHVYEHSLEALKKMPKLKEV
ncbi:MAG: hypothetical protein WEB87_06225, partial [Bacteriovoracaceae bacterium]